MKIRLQLSGISGEFTQGWKYWTITAKEDCLLRSRYTDGQTSRYLGMPKPSQKISSSRDPEILGSGILWENNSNIMVQARL